jgi:hypothetical protein
MMTKTLTMAALVALLGTTVGIAYPTYANTVFSGCTDTDDDAGFGGTTVVCRYSCPANAVLTIGVHASDVNAGTYGDTNCGEASASCNEPTFACAGVSNYLTNQAERDVRCEGNSDEINSSPVRVWCMAVGADLNAARDYVCDQVPDAPFCDSVDVPGPIVVPDLSDACLLVLERCVEAPSLEDLCGTIPWPKEAPDLQVVEKLLPFVISGVVAESDGDEGVGLWLLRDDSGLHCTAFAF